VVHCGNIFLNNIVGWDKLIKEKSFPVHSLIVNKGVLSERGSVNFKLSGYIKEEI